jgi:hypothetical protein
MREYAPLLVLLLVPIVFIGMWLLVTTLLGALSGWRRLQQHFPAGTEESLLTLGMRSGRMGGVNLNNVLTLGACQSGLRVRIPRLFGASLRPFLVPWGQIKAEPRSALFQSIVRLSFGDPEVGSLTIDARLWQRLTEACPASSAAS